MIWKWRREARSSGLGHTSAERAIIDIGSNTVRLVVYGGTMRAPTVVLNEKVTARLGRDLMGSGKMPDKAMDLALGGLARFAVILKDLEVADLNADHCFMGNLGVPGVQCSGILGVDPYYEYGNNQWGVKATMDWLKTFVRP